MLSIYVLRVEVCWLLDCIIWLILSLHENLCTFNCLLRIDVLMLQLAVYPTLLVHSSLKWNA